MHRLLGSGYRPKLAESEDSFISESVKITITTYNANSLKECVTTSIDECLKLLRKYEKEQVWVNVEGINKKTVKLICEHYKVHKLFRNDILSNGQRAKLDDIDDGSLFVLLPVILLGEDHKTIEQEQLSLILGPHFIVSFQDNLSTALFHNVRKALKNAEHPVRTRTIDFLFYLIIDATVDAYFSVLDQFALHIDILETKLNQHHPKQQLLVDLSLQRKEIMFIKRTIAPVRDVVNALWVADSELVNATNKKYFKDVLDHIVLAIEYNEGFRESVLNLQDLYMNLANTRTNAIMKTLTIVTTLVVPTTMISSLYGMNFDNLPFIHTSFGFYIPMALIVLISIIMIYFFKKQKWL